MVKAWRTVKLAWIPIGVPKNILEDHNGKILIRVLRSSTCCIVHILHGFAIEPSDPTSPSILSAARFKNLHLESVCVAFVSRINFWHIKCLSYCYFMSNETKSISFEILKKLWLMW
jgi:hypothetical protein